MTNKSKLWIFLSVVLFYMAPYQCQTKTAICFQQPLHQSRTVPFMTVPLLFYISLSSAKIFGSNASGTCYHVVPVYQYLSNTHIHTHTHVKQQSAAFIATSLTDFVKPFVDNPFTTRIYFINKTASQHWILIPSKNKVIKSCVILLTVSIILFFILRRH